MIKFNELMSMVEIIEAYKTHKFPNAYCLLLNGYIAVNLLTCENADIVEQENGRGVEVE